MAEELELTFDSRLPYIARGKVGFQDLIQLGIL